MLSYTASIEDTAQARLHALNTPPRHARVLQRETRPLRDFDLHRKTLTLVVIVRKSFRYDGHCHRFARWLETHGLGGTSRLHVWVGSEEAVDHAFEQSDHPVQFHVMNVGGRSQPSTALLASLPERKDEEEMGFKGARRPRTPTLELRKRRVY